MVTTTLTDDMPTHDVHGTDLARVLDLHNRGYATALIAECLGTDPWKIRYALVVATGDREGSPGPDRIEEMCRELQAGWTEEQAIQARHGLPRLSSKVVRPDAEAAAARASAATSAHHRKVAEQRIADGDFPIAYFADFASDKRWRLKLNCRHKAAQRFFATREEAVEFGRQWMRERLNQLDARAAEAACAGS